MLVDSWLDKILKKIKNWLKLVVFLVMLLTFCNINDIIEFQSKDFLTHRRLICWLTKEG